MTDSAAQHQAVYRVIYGDTPVHVAEEELEADNPPLYADKMPRGTLRSWLNGDDLPPWVWKHLGRAAARRGVRLDDVDKVMGWEERRTEAIRHAKAVMWLGWGRK